MVVHKKNADMILWYMMHAFEYLLILSLANEQGGCFFPLSNLGGEMQAGPGYRFILQPG